MEVFTSLMEPIDSKQLWRQIPPEEKFELMARAHSQGIFAALGAIVVGATLSVGLQLPWLLWCSILVSPVIFQGTASKTWRHLKPRVILEYLAARSASRRFAFSLNSSKLTVAAIIRGTYSEVYEEEMRTEQLEADFENKREQDVWIALFHDALIVISEQAGGARLELGQLLNKNIEVSGTSPSGQGEYASDRQINLKVTNNFGVTKNCRLTSQYPAALIVLEKQIHKQIEETRNARELPVLDLAIPVEDDGDDFLNFNLN